jgi:apolipoprotein N-acyltransferase
MRSLEFERPMIRSTNTGATALVDHRGRVLAQLAPFTRGTLAGRVEGRQGTTPFAWWAARFGLWAPALLAFAVLAACALAPRRPGKAP